MKPLDQPLFTHLLAAKHAEMAQTPKPTALETKLRYSGAYGCGRRMGYDWFEAEYSEPPTPASIFQAMVGTILGEAQANAMIEAYRGVAELSSKVTDDISGSADWFSPYTPLGVTLYEHKMKSSYAFNKALGYKRGYGRATLIEPVGAPREAIAQSGMNALGIERTYGVTVDAVVIGVVSVEIVSVNQNKQLLLSDLARFMGEWLIPREIWEPAALKEIDRLTEFAEMMDLGYIPDRLAVGDDLRPVTLTPGEGCWQCDYCPYVSLCKSDGEGQIRVLDSKLTRRVKPVAPEESE